MSSNPYQSPAQLEHFPSSERLQRRPLGISILAFLHSVGALLIATLGVFLARLFYESDANSSMLWIVLILTPLSIILSIATAIGLRRGKKWAWWLATFYYFQFAIGGVFVLAIIAFGFFFLERPVTEHSRELLIKHVFRLGLFTLLSWYMTTPRVMAYFQFQQLTRIKVFCILTGFIFMLGVLGGVILNNSWQRL